MLEFLKLYGLFLAKTITLVVAIVFVINSITMLVRRGRRGDSDRLDVKNVNEHYNFLKESLQSEILSPAERKKKRKADKKKFKQERNVDKERAREEQPVEDRKPKMFVLEFKGDIWATNVHAMREEITAILSVAQEKDEVVLLLESSGGVVHEYGLAASQLQRFRDNNLKLTVLVDKIAASGGYMMACVADRLIAAPFAVIGSIGVLAQMPNFHRLLKKHNIDYEQITAGEYKRTLTPFGENTKDAREKLTEQLEEVHTMFKDYILQHRPNLDIAKIATGEYWHAQKALELGLVDELKTSDDYLIGASETTDILKVAYKGKESVRERILHGLEQGATTLFGIFAQKNANSQIV